MCTSLPVITLQWMMILSLCVGATISFFICPSDCGVCANLRYRRRMYCRYPFETCIPFPLGVHTRWIYGSSMSHVIKSFRNTHLSIMPEPVCVPDCVSLPFLPYSSQDLFTFDYWIVAPLTGAKNPHCGFFASPADNLFLPMLAIIMSSLEKFLFKSSAH